MKKILITVMVLCLLFSVRLRILPVMLGFLLLYRQANENLLANRPFWRYNRA